MWPVKWHFILFTAKTKGEEWYICEQLRMQLTFVTVHGFILAFRSEILMFDHVSEKKHLFACNFAVFFDSLV